ncbi:DgyrCDS2772 [Dimorphilus gyrociliatus]|uniref:DgyrCDS2772 n=1 Tax=Dimorphilus gyrociliatus TaxID=2664684 RepID=A0A7I8VCI6_9ANNE|nr:DgyrCDS2772 [Dimorphilus gyrociliatus]
MQIACAIGIDKVGYVIMANGVLAVIASYTSGYLGKWLHRDIQFATSFVILFTMMIAWFCWEPQPQHPYVIFFLVGGLGTLGQHAYHTQLNALIGRIFREGETAAAFASSHLFQGLASSTLYFIAGWTGCIDIQLYLTSAILFLSCAAYAWLTIDIRRNGFKKPNVQQVGETVQDNVRGDESLMRKSILKTEPISVERSKLTNTETEIAS